MKRKLLVAVLMLTAGAVLFFRKPLLRAVNAPRTGTAVDSLDGVYVFYNGRVSHVEGRHLSTDGYNLGLKFQCVEFVKRYYYEYYHHKMPDSYGHALSFFNKDLVDSCLNEARGLLQCANPGKCKVQKGDILVYNGTNGNPYGHVAIVASVRGDDVEVIQQNPGIGAPSRVRYKILKSNDLYQINNPRILGFLRMPAKT